MMTDKMRLRWLPCIFLPALLILFPVDLSAADSRTKLMPEKFNVFIRISDISGFTENIRQSAFAKLLNDPKVRDFLGEPDYSSFLPNIIENTPDSNEFLQLFTEELKLLKGEALLSLVTDATGTSSIRFIAEIDKDDYEKSLEIDKRIAEIRPERTLFSTEEFASVTVIKTTVQSDTDTVTSWQAHLNNTIIESQDREWLEKTIIALKDNPVETSDGPPELEIKLSLDYIGTTLETGWNSIQSKNRPKDGAGAGTGKATGITAKNIMDALGLEKSGELLFTLKPGKTELEKYTALKSKPGKKGIWPLFETTRDNIEQSFPFIPENLYSWKSEALNLSGLWNSTPGILASIDPNAQVSFNIIEVMLQGSLGINLHDDILTHLEPHYSMFFQIAGNNAKTLLYWKLKNERALSASIAKLFSDQSPLRAGLGAGLSMADFRGHNVYALEIKPSPEKLTVGIAIADGHLIVGEIELVHSALRALASGAFSDASFLKSEAYDNVRKRIPVGCYSYGYTDWAMFYRYHLADILKQAIIEAQRSAMNDNNEETDSIQAFIRGLEVSKIPDPDHVASFLGPAIYYSRITDQGIESKTVFLYPQESDERK